VSRSRADSGLQTLHQKPAVTSTEEAPEDRGGTRLAVNLVSGM
jgi:hypothetical protein